MKITLKDKSIIEVETGSSVYDVAKAISEGLARAALCGIVDGVTVDLTYKIEKDATVEICTFDSPEGKKTFWHSSSHVLAAAVKRLYPDVKLAIGPAIENGFYYDFDDCKPFSPEELEKITAEMKKIIKENSKFERFTLPRDEAIQYMKNEPLKVELINDLDENAIISFYKLGDFVDLCAGPHLFDTSKIKAVALTSCTGAYWRGDASRQMVQRVYGVSFPKAAELEEHLTKLAEAKLRDHNKIGRELEFFTTSEYIGQGLPILMPKGARVIQTLQRFVEDEEEKRGYLLTKTPLMAKSDLYKISGHWDHYREGMFIMGEDSETESAFALRPMTCPFQFQVYLAKTRSFRDLPMRFGETSTLFRNESSGEMHGLIRVRQFTISEGHIACTPEQLEQEFYDCIDLANVMMKAVGLDEDVSYRFSKWDENNKEKYIGDHAQWETVQNRMREILDHLGIDYTEADGEAAFYGPKLDIQIKNVHGKEDTLVTIQIDFQLAERFEMEYTDTDGQKKHPFVIHRTSIGCYERTLALLIEKYAGALPTWLMPTQVKILPITDRQAEYANEVLSRLRASGIRAEVDSRSEKVGYKIREGQVEKIPYLLILGDKEQENKTVSPRLTRENREVDAMAIDEFIALCLEDINNKKTK